MRSIYMLLTMSAVAQLGCDDGSTADSDMPIDSDIAHDAAPMDATPDAAVPRDATTPRDAALAADAGPPDAAPIVEPESSAIFLDHVRPDLIPGRLPTSQCADITEHHRCVATTGCGWLRTIKDGGLCRLDPVVRCLLSGECSCAAQDFHGAADPNDDLELFLPLSITARNLAPRTSAFGSDRDRYRVGLSMEPVINESLDNFTSRTDFTVKRLTVRAAQPDDAADLVAAVGLTLTAKFMQVWDRAPAGLSGVLLDGLGMRVALDEGQLTVEVDGVVHAIAGEHPATGGAKDYQCNQLAIVVPETGDATVWLGAVPTVMPGLDMAAVRAAADAPDLLHIGPATAKIWDVRLYGQGRQLDADAIAEIGKRCGPAGAYPIPDGYPESNERYSWGMGGTRIVPHHAEGHFSSGVYVTVRMPEGEALPQADPTDQDNLNRMVGFWDRWHEQMYFEMELIPFIDTRDLLPEGAANTYRNYPDAICRGAECGEQAVYANPCRYTTDLFQGINWLPEDWPGEPTSADHRRVAERGGWSRWASYDRDFYQSWTRPVHEHGHTAHFTLMRSYDKVHHYLRGLAGEAFAEVMVQYVMAGVAPWMLQGLIYFPNVPLALEGRWDGQLERHVLKSDQPYQSANIGDRGIGSRFYGMGLWWTFVSHFAGKPYLIGRISGDTDETPGTVLQKTRFYLAQEGVDLGDLYGNFVAHTATWDWPQIGHFMHAIEQDPFQGIETWCTENVPDCTIDRLKIHADVPADVGTEGAWVDGPATRLPGGFASNTIRIANAPAGALYAISLEFDVPRMLFEGTPYQVGLRSTCRDDPRFFSSRIIIAESGSAGQPDRTRPQYFKIPGRLVEDVIVQVPEGAASDVLLMPVPTPPFELEDVRPFVESGSVIWPYRYKITRLDALPAGTEAAAPIELTGDAMLPLDPVDGAGFTADCFGEE